MSPPCVIFWVKDVGPVGKWFPVTYGSFGILHHQILGMSAQREAPIAMSGAMFANIGHQLVDQVAQLIDTISDRPVTPGESPAVLQSLLGKTGLPEQGTQAEALMTRAVDLLFNHSLFNGHPRFMGYITSSPAPIGALADLLAASVNANVGANILSPMATAIERQTVQWLAELIGVSPTWGGVLVSGGNMANFTAFLAARTAKAPGVIKEEGLMGAGKKLMVYCSKSTHTWIEKAAVLFGLGTRAIRWIGTGSNHQMDNHLLEQTIQEDIQHGYQPLMVIGTAGDVSTGAVDDLAGIASICKQYDLWFHVDGAYGAPAAVVPACSELFAGLNEADSIALDPHKWLYSPLEAGCTLVKDPNHLVQTFSSHPVYYNFNADDEPATLNYYEYGLQNSRGFRALKVWLALQQVGKSGYRQMIGDDIRLSQFMFRLAEEHPALQAVTQHLSICTFRYVPPHLNDTNETATYLNRLNEQLLNALQRKGAVFLSNAMVNDRYCLRSCIVNFRTTEKDIREVIDLVVQEGRSLHNLV
jgi:aromatic-L-amino-acid decarboxylase